MASSAVDGQENPLSVYMAAKLYTVAQKHLTLWGYMNDPLIFVVNKDIWNSWPPADREIVKQAAIDAGKEQIVIARKGVIEADKPLLKEIASHGVTVTQLSPRRARSLREGHAPRGREVEGPDWRRPGEPGRKVDCGTQEVTTLEP